MTNFADQHAAESLAVHIDHAAVVAVRMPTAEECARGYQAGAPVIVVADGGRDEVFPSWVTLSFDDPHGQPEPDAVQDAARYVAAIIGEQLHNVGGMVTDLAAALRRSPCSVTHLADEVREEEKAAWRCADASVPACHAGRALIC